MRYLSALVLAALPSLASAEKWQAPQEYRRLIKGHKGWDTVAFRFRGGGHARSDAVSVVDADGRPVPSIVLLSVKGDDTWVAYQGRAAKAPVHVYYGGEKKAPSGGKWQPKLSLVMRTMPLPGGALNSYSSISIADRKRQFFGLGFVPNIWHGANPYGPDDSYATVYSGYLDIKKPGKYHLATISDEASYVVLNGTDVVSWPGRHSVEGSRHGEHGKQVELTKGLHKIEYYHAEVDGPQFMALAWKRPGQKQFEPVPQEAFLHTQVLVTEAPERRNGAPLAAFGWQEVDQFHHEEYQFTRVRFTNQVKALPKAAKVVMDYGDGHVTDTVGGDHVYLSTGPFKCSLKLLGARGKVLDQFRTEIRIQPPSGNLTIRHTRQLREYLRTIGTYDLARRPQKTIEAYWTLAQPAEDPGLIRPITEAYVNLHGYKGKNWDAADRLAQALSLKEGQQADELYAKLFTCAPGEKDAARVFMERIDVIVQKLRDYDRALELIAEKKKSRNSLIARAAASKEGDVYRARGDFERAGNLYRAAQQEAYKGADPRTIAVREGGYLETVASHLEKGYLRAARETLLIWEAEHPTGKVRGDLTLMLARYFQGIGDHNRALNELFMMTKLNPLTPYLPEIELRMARSYAALGKKTKAEELRDKVIREYPLSRAAKEAKTLKF